MENIKENQSLRSFDVISIILSFLIVCGLVFLVFKKSIDNKKLLATKVELESLADQLILKPVNSSFYKTREIASDSDGQQLDPWGNRYISQVVKNSYGQPIYLVVLSMGPDSILNTQVESVVGEEQSLLENFNTQGDDVAIIKAYR